jgi:hypothetical protein
MTKSLTVRSYDRQALDPEFYQRISTFVRHQSEELKDWKADLLSRCITSVVEDGPHLAAVVWYHEVPHLHDGAWMFHAAVAKQYRRRWLSKRVLREIFWPPEHLGATRLYAAVTTPEIRSIWLRLGYTIINDPENGELAYKDAS